MTANLPPGDAVEEATRVAKQLNQQCKRLGETSRKLMREYRERMRTPAE